VNGTLAPGNGVGTLAISNNLVVNGGAVLQYALGTNSDLTVVSGNLNVGGTLDVTDAAGSPTDVMLVQLRRRADLYQPQPRLHTAGVQWVQSTPTRRAR